MTQLIETLEGLAVKATPGPWKIHGAMIGYKGDLFSPTAKLVGDCHHIARFFAQKPERKPLSDLEAIGVGREAVVTIEANAALVAALVNNLPTILSALRQVGEAERLREALGNPVAWLCSHPTETDELDFARHGPPLGPADERDGWTATPLFAVKGQNDG